MFQVNKLNKEEETFHKRNNQIKRKRVSLSQIRKSRNQEGNLKERVKLTK